MKPPVYYFDPQKQVFLGSKVSEKSRKMPKISEKSRDLGVKVSGFLGNLGKTPEKSRDFLKVSGF